MATVEEQVKYEYGRYDYWGSQEPVGWTRFRWLARWLAFWHSGMGYGHGFVRAEDEPPSRSRVYRT